MKGSNTPLYVIDYIGFYDKLVHIFRTCYGQVDRQGASKKVMLDKIYAYIKTDWLTDPRK